MIRTCSGVFCQMNHFKRIAAVGESLSNVNLYDIGC